ncbi:DUF3021 domain-containing protein [Ornithinibacillus sp. 4-3]|uniref:DUF3021 domain-containing protein n=1 Tax=Ornithinibacillus sp. 4-3 TaxID=3231488 RepID=A0AB39HSI2_9BACI
MVLEILKRSMIGIAFGGICTFIALTIMMLNEFDATVTEVWQNMGASMLLGIYFGISSLIFGSSGSNIIKKSLIHFALSYSIWLIIASIVGWVPLSIKAVLWSTLVFILIYILNWFGWYSYFKKIETVLNNHLQKHK